MIRTDCHPNSLLDATDLAYQGGALHSKKCYDKNRWWKLHYLEVSDTQVTVMFETYRKGKYLAEKVDKTGVELIELEKDWNDKIIAIPTDKWHSSIVGRALTPGQVAGVIVGAP